jgi:hypothetical protein
MHNEWQRDRCDRVKDVRMYLLVDVTNAFILLSINSLYHHGISRAGYHLH